MAFRHETIIKPYLTTNHPTYVTYSLTYSNALSNIHYYALQNNLKIIKSQNQFLKKPEQ